MTAAVKVCIEQILQTICTKGALIPIFWKPIFENPFILTVDCFFGRIFINGLHSNRIYWFPTVRRRICWTYIQIVCAVIYSCFWCCFLHQVLQAVCTKCTFFIKKTLSLIFSDPSNFAHIFCNSTYFCTAQPLLAQPLRPFSVHSVQGNKQLARSL